ncbi:MAG: hypothetical protein HQL38_08530 [Alphaproteobacteria bacterium]|nr:hypothetical protein [Alphaproteobacteria bacterium]
MAGGVPGSAAMVAIAPAVMVALAVVVAVAPAVVVAIIVTVAVGLGALAGVGGGRADSIIRVGDRIPVVVLGENGGRRSDQGGGNKGVDHHFSEHRVVSCELQCRYNAKPNLNET